MIPHKGTDHPTSTELSAGSSATRQLPHRLPALVAARRTTAMAHGRPSFNVGGPPLFYFSERPCSTREALAGSRTPGFSGPSGSSAALMAEISAGGLVQPSQPVLALPTPCSAATDPPCAAASRATASSTCVSPGSGPSTLTCRLPTPTWPNTISPGQPPGTGSRPAPA